MAEGSRIIIDQGKKLIKVIWDGKMDFTEIKDLCEKVTDELKKFKKGEPLVPGDTRALDMRFVPAGSDKPIQEGYLFSISYCKKSATLVSSMMLEKQLEKSSGNDSGSFRMFDSKPEAMKWLLE